MSLLGYAEAANPRTHAKVVQSATVELILIPGQRQPQFRLSGLALLRAFVEQVVEDDECYALLYSGPHLTVIEEAPRILRPGNGRDEEDET